MSDDFHRPTYTTEDEHGAFNATQVRLYGIPGLTDDNDKRSNNPMRMYTAVGVGKLAIAKSNGALSPDTIEILKNTFGAELVESKYSYVFISAIMRNYLIMLGALNTASTKAKKGKNDAGPEKPLTCGIIFGYAYEGHTYDLPKPKIMMIPALPRDVIPADDSGYNKKSSEGYRVWLVDKLDQCVEIDVNQGFIEQIVLDANLPGKRSPTMYVGRMMLAHRSGRLSE